MDGLELNHNPEHMFIENVLQFTMTSDSQPSVKPVKAEAKTPTEVYDMFGTTSYRKGASLIRMIQNFVGPDNFRAALQNFMRKLYEIPLAFESVKGFYYSFYAFK